MVESDKNPTSETQIKAQKEEKKIIVHSPRGKLPTYVSLHAPMNVLHLLSPLSAGRKILTINTEQTIIQSKKIRDAI